MRILALALALFLAAACAGPYPTQAIGELGSTRNLCAGIGVALALTLRACSDLQRQKAAQVERDSWSYVQETNLLTDRAYSVAGFNNRWGRVSIHCSSEGELWAELWSKSTIHGGDRIRIWYRIDERPAVSSEWSWDWWDTATTRTQGDAHRLARAVASATDRVILMLEGNRDMRTHVFPVVRVAETVDRVLTDCGLSR